MTRRRSVRSAVPWLAVGVLVLGACGMRGPPRPPIITLPSAVSPFEVRRLEDRVYVRFTVPSTNSNRTAPADLERVEIYALTTDPRLDPPVTPPLEDWVDAATLVATYDVLPPPDPLAPTSETEAVSPGVDLPPNTVEQGDVVTLVETLTPDLTEPHVFEYEAADEDDDEDDDDDLALTQPLALPYVAPPIPGLPRRTYLAVAYSTRGRESAPSSREAVSLVAPPPAPSPPRVEYGETSVVVTWSEADGARRPVQAPVVPPDPVPAAPAGEELPELATDPDVGTAPEPGGVPGATDPDVPDVPEPGVAPVAVPDVDPVAVPDVDPVAAPDLEPVTEAPVPEPVEPTRLEARPIVPQPPVSAYLVFAVPSDLRAEVVLPAPLNPPLPAATTVPTTSVGPPAGRARRGAAGPDDAEAEEAAGPEGAEAAAGAEAEEAPPFRVPMPEPATTEYRQLSVPFGQEQCYVVRTRDVVDGLAVLGPASPPTCVVPVDTFPPAAPLGLLAVAGEDAISLVWSPSPESDIGGYRVRRREAPDEDWTLLTPEPVEGTSYQDATVESGVLYVYVVEALDEATPPNVSPPSVEVSEGAR